MKRACVIGWPIEHSRSPMIHGYWLDKYAIKGSYDKVAVRPEDLESFLSSLADHGFVGCNVTVPHKEQAFQLAGHREPSSLAVGAANTIWLEDGKTCAANTDTYGFMTHLEASAPDWNTGTKPVAILGAGGAARAICYGFIQAGVTDIVVLNRTASRAGELADDLGQNVRAGNWEERTSAPQWASVIVNTTTLGMKGEGDLKVDFTNADPACVVADIVYVPLETRLLSGARQNGLRTVDGLGMLLHQAVPGFEKWFGVRPQVTDELRGLILADLGQS
ncbi:MAG: shikimate dehydrogenase [Alphaproteobacteria bacterium]|nr:shikimate dehydrogenase [Alphaproteobacteria bacterium]